MDFLVTRVLPVVIILVVFYVLPVLGVPERKEDAKSLPKAIKIASLMEAAFGIIVFFSGIFIAMDPSHYGLTEPRGSLYALLFCFLLGMSWLLLAIHLNFGNTKARTVCLVVSVLRLPTVFGAVFSLIDIYLLYFTKQSKEFYSVDRKAA